LDGKKKERYLGHFLSHRLRIETFLLAERRLSLEWLVCVLHRDWGLVFLLTRRPVRGGPAICGWCLLLGFRQALDNIYKKK
jgi:hypothetical protein